MIIIFTFQKWSGSKIMIALKNATPLKMQGVEEKCLFKGRVFMESYYFFAYDEYIVFNKF